MSLKEELLHIKIHRNQILREYERHKAQADEVEAKLQSVVRNVHDKYNVNLEEYAPRFLPTYEAVLHDNGEHLLLSFVCVCLSCLSYRASLVPPCHC